MLSGISSCDILSNRVCPLPATPASHIKGAADSGSVQCHLVHCGHCYCMLAEQFVNVINSCVLTWDG